MGRDRGPSNIARKRPDVSLRLHRRNECTSLKRLRGLDEATSIPRREGYLHLRRCGSTSRSCHPRGQYRAEHSRTGNQLTEDNDKRRRIEARNTGSNGRQSGGQKPRYPVRGDVNPIASRFSSALHRCYNCC